MIRDDFAVFILSHGRANNIKTLKALEKQGYTGKWFVVIDNEDNEENEYRRLYKEHVIQFDKLEISKTFDTADLENNRKTVVYARNACFEIAKQIGVKYFLELDDDYLEFEHRYIKDNKLKLIRLKDLDKVFESTLEYFISSNALTIAYAQCGDFIGGADSCNFQKKILRKAMNTFFCSVDRPFQFVGRINEDVNTYTLLGQQGKLLMTITDISINQMQTQKNKSGMSDVYLDQGTYLKSFYSVLYSPSCVHIAMMGDKHARIHHQVTWENCCPKIINKKWCKNNEGI